MATQFNSKTNKAKPAPAPAAKPVVKVAAKPSRAPTPEEISSRAYEIYLSEGCPEGSSLEHWLRAERELRSGG
jgi:hypothetical protein